MTTEKTDITPVKILGTVTMFKGNGRKLGYPTANIAADPDLKDGVYLGFADLGKFKSHPATIFIGKPTTLGDIVRRVEAWLIDIPDQDYYRLKMTLTLQHYVRPNQTFSSVAELITHLKQDETYARKWFKLNSKS